MDIDVVGSVISSEDDDRRYAFFVGKGMQEVKAIADFACTVMNGRHTGTVIVAFAWAAVSNEAGYEINVTEESTGRRLAHIPVAYKNEQGQPEPIFEESLFEAMLPSMIEGAAYAAFEKFQQADDIKLGQMLDHIKQHAQDTLPIVH